MGLAVEDDTPTLETHDQDWQRQSILAGTAEMRPPTPRPAARTPRVDPFDVARTMGLTIEEDTPDPDPFDVARSMGLTIEEDTDTLSLDAALPSGPTRADDPRRALPAAGVDEPTFQAWYGQRAKTLGLDPNPDAPEQSYDYRAAFAAGAEPGPDGHWPSAFKKPGHPNEVVGGFNTRTGARVPGTPRASRDDLVRLGWEPDAAARLDATQEPSAAKSMGDIMGQATGISRAPEPRGALGTLADFGMSLPRRLGVDPVISAVKGAIGAVNVPVGLADIATGGRVGQFLEETIGFRPAEATKILSSWYSKKQREGSAAVQAADGVLATAVAALSNPGVVANTVVESAPMMLAGGAIGRAIPYASAGVRGALGEGIASAGSAASHTREGSEDGRLTVKQSALAVATGAATTTFGLLGNRIAQSLGIADIDTMIAAGAASPVAARGLATRVALGMVQEGVLEELPQSISEQLLANVAQDRPILEGVDESAVLGLFSGAVMGGGANIRRPRTAAGAPPAPPLADLASEAPPAGPSPAPVDVPPVAPRGAPPAYVPTDLETRNVRRLMAEPGRTTISINDVSSATAMRPREAGAAIDQLEREGLVTPTAQAGTYTLTQPAPAAEAPPATMRDALGPLPPGVSAEQTQQLTALGYAPERVAAMTLPEVQEALRTGTPAVERRQQPRGLVAPAIADPMSPEGLVALGTEFMENPARQADVASMRTATRAEAPPREATTPEVLDAAPEDRQRVAGTRPEVLDRERPDLGIDARGQEIEAQEPIPRQSYEDDTRWEDWKAGDTLKLVDGRIVTVARAAADPFSGLQVTLDGRRWSVNQELVEGRVDAVPTAATVVDDAATVDARGLPIAPRDAGVIPARMAVKFANASKGAIEVSTLVEAKRAAQTLQAQRDDNGPGAGRLPVISIIDAETGEQFAVISPNGRIWRQAAGKKWTPATKEIDASVDVTPAADAQSQPGQYVKHPLIVDGKEVGQILGRLTARGRVKVVSAGLPGTVEMSLGIGDIVERDSSWLTVPKSQWPGIWEDGERVESSKSLAKDVADDGRAPKTIDRPTLRGAPAPVPAPKPAAAKPAVQASGEAWRGVPPPVRAGVERAIGDVNDVLDLVEAQRGPVNARATFAEQGEKLTAATKRLADFRQRAEAKGRDVSAILGPVEQRLAAAEQSFTNEDAADRKKAEGRTRIAEFTAKYKAEGAALAERFARDGYLYATDPKSPNRALFLAPSTRAGVKYQVTSFHSGEPTGHRDYDKLGNEGKVGPLDSAVSEFRGMTLQERPRSIDARPEKTETEAHDADGRREGAETGPVGDVHRGSRTGVVARAHEDRAAKNRKRRVAAAKRPAVAAANAVDALYADVLADAQALDPLVDPADVRAEWDFRAGMLLELGAEAAAADPRVLLKRIAKSGGIYQKSEINKGKQAEEVTRLSEGQRFGNVLGIGGVFASQERKMRPVARKVDGQAKIVMEMRGGLPLDVLLQDLQAEGDFPFLNAEGADVNTLTDWLDDVQKSAATPRATIMEKLEITRGTAWWENRWVPEADAFASDAVDTGEGDDSFDFAEIDEPVSRPFTAATLQEAMGLPEEQAAATYALAEAMGLDLDQVEVVKGGTPGSGALEQQKTRLSVLHNLSAENLAFVGQMGGIPVPSLGITKQTGAMRGFGEITLIGRAHLADPTAEPVFDADAYSGRSARPLYPPVKMAVAKPFYDALRPYAVAFDDAHDETWDNLVREAKPKDIIRRMARGPASAAWFLDAVHGTTVQPVREVDPAKLMWSAMVDAATFTDAYQQMRGDGTEDAGTKAMQAVLSSAVDLFLDSPKGRAYAAAITERGSRRTARAQIASAWGQGPEWLTDVDALGFGMVDTVRDDIRRRGQTRVNTQKTNARVARALKGKEAEFATWVDEKVWQMFGPPYLTVNGKKAPYTLANIVDAATSTRIRGDETTMTYGPGKARAAASRRFTGLEQMRSSAERSVLDEEAIEAGRLASLEALEAYRDSVIGAHDEGTWEALDASMRAIARYAGGAKTDANMRNALRREGFKVSKVDNAGIVSGMEAARLLLAAPVPYFEAKPQRAVMLNEFAGAVIPKDASPETRAILDTAGLPYVEYSNKGGLNEAKRGAAVVKFRRQLSRQGQNVLFQKAGKTTWEAITKYRLPLFQQVRHGSQRQSDATGAQASVEFAESGKAIIRGLENPNVSSGVHELAHIARRWLFNRDIPAENRRGITDEDIATAEDWAGAKDGTWGEPAEEKFARGFERYLRDGATPTTPKTMRGIFAKFAAWLGDVYASLEGSPIDVDISPAMRGVFDRLVTRRERNAAEDTKADTLDTGEVQNRLPGDVGAVRDEERAQPTEEVPFSLTSEIGTRSSAQGTLGGLTSALDQIEQAAKDRITKRGTFSGKRLSAGLPIDDLADFAVIGAAKVARGAATLARFTAEMVREFGEAIREHIPAIFADAKNRAALVSDLDIDDYFNLKRVNISDEERAELRGSITETIIRTGRIPKERESWDAIRAEARQLHPDAVRHLAGFQQAQAPFRAVRDAARRRINVLNQEIVEGWKAMNGSADPEDLLVREAVLAAKERDVQGLLDTWMRMRSEDGRNLAMHRMMADSMETWYDATFWMSKAKRQLELPPGVDLPIDVARALRDILGRGREAVETGMDATPIQLELSTFLTKLRRSTLLETIAALRKAGLLTGPKTHARNILGNAAFQILEETMRLPAVLVDMAVAVGTGHRTVHGISARAVSAASKHAATRGLQQAADVLRTGQTSNEMRKTDAVRELNSGIRWIDSYVNFVGRTMAATDRVFKSYAFRRSLEEQAALEAINTGVSPIELLARPSETMLARAVADAEFATFNNKNMVAEAVSHMKGSLRRHGDAGAVAAFTIEMAVPFVNTPSNIVARMLDYTPVGLAGKAGKAAASALVNKGMTVEQQRVFSLAIGRGLTGSALIYLGWTLAAAGLATGTGGDDEGDRNVRTAAGMLNGAVRIGNRWHQIATFSPAGNLVSLGAEMQRTSSRPFTDESKRAGKMIGIGAGLVLDQPMLKGMNDLIEALQRPESAGENFAASLAGSFVPTLVNDAASAFDPYRRNARPDGVRTSLWVGAQSRLPGLRNSLPPRLNVFGDRETQETRAIWDPTIATVARDMSDGVLRELIAHDVGVGWPQKRRGEAAEDYAKRVRVTGEAIRTQVTRVVASQAYRRATDGKQTEMLDDAIASARTRVRPKFRPRPRARFQEAGQ